MQKQSNKMLIYQKMGPGGELPYETDGDARRKF